MQRTLIRDQALRDRARLVIPGGMYGHQDVGSFPSDFPQYFARAEGARLWDCDGNEYIDYICAFGTNLLGYRRPEIERAALQQAGLGDSMTGPAPLMVDLAERMVDLIEHSQWILFCKNGTDATTLCLTIARAETGRRKVLRAAGAYHGAAPWCTPRLKGVLDEDRRHLIEFEYNDIASIEKAVDQAGTDLAAIVSAPIRHDARRDQELPNPAFVRRVRELCDQTGSVLILDEVRTGLRLRHGGSWEPFGVRPDLSAWGKAIANGYSLSAVAGNERLRDAASGVWATGSYWFSAVPMAAALATLNVAETEGVAQHTETLGAKLRRGIAEQASASGIGIRQSGPPQMPLILFEDDPELKKGYRWTAEAIKRGVYLHPWHNMFLSAAHTEADIDHTLEVTSEAFTALQESES